MQKQIRSHTWLGVINNPDEPENTDSFLKKLHEHSHAAYTCG